MGLQCPKLLWFRYNAKDQIPAPDEATQAVFDQGTEVGEFARSLFPDGLVVAPGIIEPDKVIPETRKASACLSAAFKLPYPKPQRRASPTVLEFPARFPKSDCRFLRESCKGSDV